MIRQLPNVLTLGNLFCGVYGIIIAASTFTISQPNNYLAVAGLMVVLGAVLDVLDGYAARLLNARSELGRQLDSLADLTTFGLLPGIVLYQLMVRSYEDFVVNFHIGEVYALPIVVGFAYIAGAALRLAKFNTDAEQTEQFKGLATPAAALLVVSLPLMLEYDLLLLAGDSVYLTPYLRNPALIAGVALAAATLMVSGVPMLSFKNTEHRKPMAALMLVGIITFGLTLFLALPVTIIAYILLSLTRRTQPAEHPAHTNA